MAITAPDLKFIASERMSDTLADASTGAGGGGFPGQAFVQTAVENNVFPDVTPTDRTTGRLRLRLVYPAVVSLDNDAATSAAVGIDTAPTDADVDLFLLPAREVDIPAANARNALDAALRLVGFLGLYPASFSGSATVSATANRIAGFSTVAVGQKVRIAGVSSSAPTVQVFWRTVTAVDGGANHFDYDGSSIALAATTVVFVYVATGAEFSVSAQALTTASASAGATSLTLNRTEVRVYPQGSTLATPGVPALGLTEGRVPAFKVGDTVWIQHPSTPATRETALVAGVNYHTHVLTFALGLTNAYPSGTKVCKLADVGTLQAGLSVSPFTQASWTRVWQGSRIGAAIVAQYNGVVGLVNAGAETDRYAIVFRNATQFDLISERRGQIAAGNIATDFSPLNPLTNEPLFTLYASAWGTGWLLGNTLRFDVVAANAGCWAALCVSPSAPGGDDTGLLFLRADVDA